MNEHEQRWLCLLFFQFLSIFFDGIHMILILAILTYENGTLKFHGVDTVHTLSSHAEIIWNVVDIFNSLRIKTSFQRSFSIIWEA